MLILEHDSSKCNHQSTANSYILLEIALGISFTQHLSLCSSSSFPSFFFHTHFPTAVAKWDPNKPMYTRGLGTSRPPPLSDEQEQEAGVDLGDSNDSAQLQQHEQQQHQDQQPGCTGGVNGAALQQPHGEGTSQLNKQQIQGYVLMHIEKEAEYQEGNTEMSFSVNQEPNLQYRNNISISIQNFDPETANIQQDKSPHQQQINEDKGKQPMPIKELLKQAFKKGKDNNDNSSSVDIWNFRDKPKLKPNTDDKGRKIIQRKTATAPYIVEVAEEEEDMEENIPQQSLAGVWEMELAQTISNNLRIKRKRPEAAHLCIEGNDTTTKNTTEEDSGSKRIKEDFAADMAEEAGLTTPQPKP